MKVKSFGCSFIFGNELPDDSRHRNFATASQLTWPALVAKSLDADYQCFARPGAGNLRILEQIMHQAGLDNHNTLYIIGWTWIERFDFITDATEHNHWQPQWHAITPTTKSDAAEFYYKYFHTELKDKIQSLIYIRMAIDLLKQKNIPFVMTCIDRLLLDRRWHIPVAVTDTQDYVCPYIKDFQGQTFLDWSSEHGFAMGEWLHPLEDAHRCAADLMLPHCQQAAQNLIPQ